MEGFSELAAGGLGGLACVITGQPFDTIKVKLQTYPSQFTSPMQAFTKTLAEERFLAGMYAGCAPAVVSNIAENAVLFLCYSMCQRAVRWTVGAESTKQLTVFQQASAGSLASVFSSIAITPPDRVKCLLQTRTAGSHNYSSTTSMTGTAAGERSVGAASTQRHGSWNIVRSIVREEGFFGLFRGLTSTWIREVPGYFFFFGSYHASLRLLHPGDETADSTSNFLRQALAGGMAGAGFWATVYPVDVVKSRIQVRGEYSGSFWRTCFEVIRKEGFRALYKGLSPTIARAFPANAALFVTYEYSSDFFKNGLRSRNSVHTDNSSEVRI